MNQSIQKIRPGLIKIMEPWIPIDGVRKSTPVSVTKVHYESNKVEFEIVSNHVYVNKFHGVLDADVFLQLADDAIKFENCKKKIVGDKDGHLVYSENVYIHVPHYKIEVKTRFDLSSVDDVRDMLKNQILKFVSDSNFKIGDNKYQLNIDSMTVTKSELQEILDEIRTFADTVECNFIG